MVTDTIIVIIATSACRYNYLASIENTKRLGLELLTIPTKFYSNNGDYIITA